MSRELSLFVGTFTTLLAIINPIEVMPVYLKLLEGKDVATHRRVEGMRLCVVSEPLLPDLWHTDPAPVRRTAGHGSYCRWHHPGQDRF